MGDPQAEAIRHVLTTSRVVAAVGFSDRDRTKANYYVPAYLKGQGYRVLPVNPRLERGLGQAAYASLAEAPQPIDVALLYVPARRLAATVEEAVAAGARAVWLPLGVVPATAADEAAVAQARAAGLQVITDRCMMVEHKHM